jgi:TetR/AcrR family transcriptional repressor of nem operon
VQAGQAEGSIARGRDAEDLGRLLLTLLLGLRVLTRGRPDRAVMEGALRQGLGLLDEAPDASAIRSA